MKKLLIAIFVTALFVSNFSNIIYAQKETDMINIVQKNLTDIIINNKTNNEKLEQAVNNLIKNIPLSYSDKIEQINTFDFVDQKVRLEIILSDSDKLDLLTAFNQDIIIESSYENLVQALVPISSIESLSKEQYVSFIQRPVIFQPCIVSEGVGVINADVVHSRGFYGAGVKLAIIDGGFTGYATNPEIPSQNIKEVKSFRGDGQVETSIHGTACAEIVLDVAPNVDLYLYVIQTEIEFCNALNYAVSKGVNVVSVSGGFFLQNDLDGSGTICNAINSARAAGVLVCISSGNMAESHYCGWYDDDDGDDFHDFDTGDNALFLGYIPAYYPIDLYLSWNDWPGSDQDYNLYLVSYNYGLIVGSENSQSGTEPPIEYIGIYATVGDYWFVFISDYVATSSVRFQLFSSTCYFYDNLHPETSIICPADAAGAMTVGATHWSNDNIESYSSRGPTNDGRIKPDVTAPDYVSTYTYGTQGFPGTSASAPHTAGAAALLKGVNSSLTANQLQSVLEATALPLGSPGKDNLYGSGRIDVWNAFNSSLVNIPPVAHDDYYTTNEDITLNVTALGVLANDTDGDNDTLTAVKISNPSHGTLSLLGNGSFVYVPASNYYGLDSFSYKVYDRTVYSNVATVHINITSVNDAPVVGDIPNQTIAEGSTFMTINLDTYVSDADNTDDQMNWTYAGNSELTVSIMNRIATISIPDVNWYGAETIIFNATDPLGLWDTDAAVFMVTSVNDPPVAHDDTALVIEDSSDNQINVILNDTDIDGDTLTVVSVTSPSHGSSTTDGNYVYYTPNTNYSGADSFTYTISDGNGGTDTAMVHIIIPRVNDPPAADFTFEPINPTTQEIVYFNCTSYDSDGSIINWTWDFDDGNYSYEQNPTHQYTANRTYLIKLNVTDNDSVTITIQKPIIVSPNYPPTISNPYPTNESTNVPLSDNLSWDGEDPNSDAVTYDVYFGTNSLNKVSSNQTGTTYEPGTMNFNTTYYWRIVAWDTHGAETTSPIWHFTTRTNHPPSATPDSYSTNEDVTLTVPAPGVLGNDDDFDGDSLTVVKVNNTIHGSVTLNINGSFSYVPSTNYYGIDTFSYKAYDGFVYSSIVNVTITIHPVNDPPMFGTPSPGNGSTVYTQKVTWSIPIRDIEGDNFSWSIQCSNGQANNSNGDETNGTKTLSLSGLVYSTTYTIWVNASDLAGSNQYTKKWYTFKPVSSSGGGGGSSGGGYVPPSEPENKKPIANTSAGEPYQGNVNLEITFDGTSSYDSDGNITSWFWEFGDDTNATGEIVKHIYSTVGTYNVTLTVTDNEGATNSDRTICVIKQPNRSPTIPIVVGVLNGTKNTLYTLSVVSTDADNDALRYSINWGDETSYVNTSIFLPNGISYNCSHCWTTAGRYYITVTVSDNKSQSSSKTTVYIDALQTGDIGYLIDYNGDGIYDAFYSDVSKQITAVQNKDGGYNIDIYGNGEWDFTFDAAQGLTSYQEAETPGFEIIFVFCAISVAIFLWKRKLNV